MRSRTILRAGIAASAAALVLVPASPAAAHPYGMCHVAGQSGTVVYFPPGRSADAHHRHMLSGVHSDNYEASMADALDFAATGDRKCEDSKEPPGGTGD